LYCRNSPGTPTGKKYALLASVKSTVPTVVEVEVDLGMRRHPGHPRSASGTGTWGIPAN
jgi:hypothetical protein